MTRSDSLPLACTLSTKRCDGCGCRSDCALRHRNTAWERQSARPSCRDNEEGGEGEDAVTDDDDDDIEEEEEEGEGEGGGGRSGARS